MHLTQGLNSIFKFYSAILNVLISLFSKKGHGDFLQYPPFFQEQWADIANIEFYYVIKDGISYLFTWRKYSLYND